MNRHTTRLGRRETSEAESANEEAVVERLIGPRRHGAVPIGEILSRCGGLAGIATATFGRLESAGLHPREAERIAAALELSRRACQSVPSGAVDRAAIVTLLRPTLELLLHEEMHAVFLGPDGRYLGRAMLAKGGSDAVSMHLRDVLGPAVDARASRLVLAHNHPSGHCAPSPEDVSLSSRVEQAAHVVGIRLIDHLVFARDGVASAMPDGAHWAPLARPRGMH